LCRSRLRSLSTGATALKPGEAAKFDVRRGEGPVELQITPGLRPAQSAQRMQRR
jgi:hypothetical protein